MTYKITNPVFNNFQNETVELFQLCQAQKVNANKLSKEINKAAFKIATANNDAKEIQSEFDMANKIIEEQLFLEEEKTPIYPNENDMQSLKTFIENQINKVKGDLFEIFGEIFFAIHSGIFGLTNYKCNKDDYGVDGAGVNLDGASTVVQYKFRSNPNDLITYSDLAKTFSQGYKDFKFPLKEKNTLCLFTNTNGANNNAKEKYSDILYVIDRNYIDNVIKSDDFWNRFNIYLNQSRITNVSLFDYKEYVIELFSLCSERLVDITDLTREIKAMSYRIIDERWKNDKWNVYDLLRSGDKVGYEKHGGKNVTRDLYNKAKGDLFEIFGEVFFALSPLSINYGINNYMCNHSNDYGVDATGTNPNGHQTVIQYKFRSNPLNLITYGDLAKTVSQGYRDFGYELNKKATLYLFTNANGANWRCEKKFYDILHVINGKHIDAQLRHDHFWKSFNLILGENI